jgi:glycosyltransferase involved in cell wall biosynthesis
MANVCPDPNSGAAGTEYHTIAALRAAGCSVDTVWRNELSHRISHPNLHNLLELPLAYRNAMLCKLSQGFYDVVHVNQPHGYLAARSLAKLCPKSVFVHRSHGFEGRVRHELKPWVSRYGIDTRPAWRRTLSLAIESALQYNNRMIPRCAHGHIVSASECKSFLTERYGVDAERIAVIPQASPRAFHDLDVRPMQRDRMRKILYVGQFAFFKGPVVLVRAIERVLHEVPEATFTWICDRRHHEAARGLFVDNDVLQRVNLFDWMNQTDLMQAYDAHGLFVSHRSSRGSENPSWRL